MQTKREAKLNAFKLSSQRETGVSSVERQEDEDFYIYIYLYKHAFRAKLISFVYAYTQDFAMQYTLLDSCFCRCD